MELVSESERNLIIPGAEAYANTLKDIAEQLGYEIIPMLDDKLLGFELSTYVNYISLDKSFIPAFGNNEFRLQWISKIQSAGATIATLIHPTAYVSPKVTIEPGCVVLPKAVVNTNTVVRSGGIINIGAIVDHDCILEDGCHIAPGAIVKGENHLPLCMKVESGHIVERGQYPILKHK